MMQRPFSLSKLTLAIALALPNIAMANTTEDDIEVIEVKGRAQQFYLQTDTKVGTKVDADIMDIPQSVQVLTEELMEDQAAREITDLYRSIAGVSSFSYSGVTFRGFRDDENVFYDGVRGDPFSGFGIPQLFNIERVEVLKGPSGALYGAGEPGGMINYVSKRPSFAENHEFNVTVGSEDRYGGSIDNTGELTDTIAYRFGAFYEQADSFRNNADEQNTDIAGGLLFALGEATDLYTTFEYIDQDLGGARLRGVPVDDDGNFLVDPSYNANEKSDFQKLEALVLQATLEHEFSDVFTNNTTLRYLDNERNQQYHESRSWIDANGDGQKNADDQVIRREYRKQYRANTEYSLTTDFVYQWQQHQFLFGGDYHNVDTKYDYLRARYEADGVPNLNIFDPVYGVADPSTYNLTDQNRDGEKSTRYSAYLQDIYAISEQWKLLLGFRYDHFDIEDKASGNSYSDSNVLPRAGIVYQPTSDTSIYLNYSESFNPQSVGDQFSEDGEGNLDPETGDQIELGMKNKWMDGAFVTTFAIYQITKENMAMTNPADTGEGDGIPELVNLGKVESKGFEATITGDLSNDWTITANYAYNDTKVVDGVEGDSVGNTYGDGSRFVNAPEHQAGLWTRYDLGSIDSAIAFGADYVSEQISFDGQKVKAYTVFDASWTTDIDAHSSIRVNISNLFDEEYAISGFSERNGHFPGAPREIIVSYSYQL